MDIESEVVDLSKIPLSTLRALDDAELTPMLRRILDQTSHPSITVGGACSRAGFE